MTNPLKETYCCCQLFSIRQGIFLIAVHTFLQATYGILVVVTSHYRSENSTVNSVVIAGNICFFPAGLLVFATTLYNSNRVARLNVFFFSLVSIFNFGASICYILVYNGFKANSELDKMLFWRDDKDWVNNGELPFTFWHILAFLTCFVLILWWYYAYQLWKYTKLLKLQKELELERPKSDSSFASRKGTNKFELFEANETERGSSNKN